MDIGKIFQLVSTLGSLKESRLNREESKRQHDEQLKLTAERMGLEAKSSEFKAFMDLAKLFDEGSPETKARIGPVLQAFVHNPAQADALQGVASGAPSVTRLRDQEAWKGLASASPEQRARTQAEAYSGSASGMNTGQVAQSGLNADLMNGARNVYATLGDAGQRMINQGVLGNTAQPMKGNVEMAGGQLPGPVHSLMAQIQGGTAMPLGQKVNADLAAQGLNLQTWQQADASAMRALALEMEAKKANGQLQPDDITKIASTIVAASNAMNQKNIAPAQAQMLQDVINRLTPLMGVGTMGTPTKPGMSNLWGMLK